MRIEFRVLGTIDLRAIEDGHAQPLDLPPKVRALLAYLALERPHRLHARDTLRALFWPELDEEHARSNLRRALFVLRAQIGSEALITRGQEEVGLDRERFWCDAVAFDELAGKDPEGALALYRGELLPAVHLDGSAEFERWLETERTRLRDRAQAALGELGGRAESDGRLAEAVRWQRKMLEIDPYDEGALRRLMLLRARLGDRAGALQAYEAFERRLREDLELEPDDETRALAEAVRGGEIAVEGPSDIPSVMVSQTKTSHAAPPSGDVAESGTETGPRRERRRPQRMVLAGLAALTLLAALGFLLRGREGSRGTASGGDVAPAIAVVPFRVSDPELELWQEGMVDLLSVNLDDAGGLRTIDSRTMMALWREAASGDTDLDLARTLEIARSAGGAFAVVGSAISVGTEVRLSAVVHDLSEGAALGEVQVTGSPDSVIDLVDRLSVDILRTIMGRRSDLVPRPRLASVTTSSLPALKAFLEGERLLRRSRIDEAVEAYERAVAADSTFALVYTRLAPAYGWIPPGRRPVERPLMSALKYDEHLSKRDGELLRARIADWVGSPRLALDLLRQVVRKHPEDAEAWHLIGEIYFHFHGSLLADLDDAERAIERAVALDPTFAPYWFHLIDTSFHDADSTEATARLATYARLAPDDFDRHLRPGFEVAFRDSAASLRALESMDTLSSESLYTAIVLLGYHARTFAAQEAVLREALTRTDLHNPGYEADRLALLLVHRGRRNAALEQLGDSLVRPKARAMGLYLMKIHDMEPPPERLQAALGSWNVPDSISSASFWQSAVLFWTAAHAVDRGRWSDHLAIIERLRHLAPKFAAGDTVHARAVLGAARALEGYGLWRRGQPEKALPHLQTAQEELTCWETARSVEPTVRWWIGYLLLELDRPSDALRYFVSLWESERSPFAAFEVAMIHERQGGGEAALEAYNYALTGWRNADPVVRPRVEAARAAVNRLSGAGG